MVDEYLNGNVKDILEPMISALLIAQPEDPKFFMLHWLKNLYSLDYIIINKEKEELENLRLEVKGYKAQKTETNKQNTEQPLEEFKNKIIDETKENLNIKEIKETEKELETNKTNKENEVETNKQNQETNNQNTNNQNTNNQNNETENKNNDDKSEKASKTISINENKNETKNNNETKNENTDIKNENNNIKDLINFSEESDN